MSRYRLKVRREKLGLTQYDLAQRANIRHAAQVSQAENGRAHGRVVQQIRRALCQLEADRRAKRREWSHIARAEKCWATLPDSPEKTALLEVLTDRVRSFYDKLEWEQGDIILEMLPKELAEAILNECFPD